MAEYFEEPVSHQAQPENDFRSDLKSLLNKHNIEGGSNTPDFILADFLIRCIDNFTETTQSRESWYGTRLVPGRSANATSNEGTVGSTTP